MKHFYLIANPSKPGALDMAEKLETELLRRGASCVHARGYTRADQIPADTECIIIQRLNQSGSSHDGH